MYTIEDIKIIKTKILATKKLMTEEEIEQLLNNINTILTMHKESSINIEQTYILLNELYITISKHKDINLLKEANLNEKKKNFNPHTRNVYNKTKRK